MTSTTLPVSEEEINFRKSADLVGQLQSLLNATALSNAIRILRDECRPRGLLPDPAPGLHPDTNLAHYYHFQQGCNVILDRLLRMGKSFDPREITETQTDDEFEHFGNDLKELPIPEHLLKK